MAYITRTMSDVGRMIMGDEAATKESAAQLADQPVDQVMKPAPDFKMDRQQVTIAEPFSVTGPGTFLGKATRTLTFEPSDEEGWWFDRVDMPDSLPIRCSIHNIWTTDLNLVLCSGSPHNYMRMVEHIIALRLGMGLDNVLIKMDSGDPPLFDRSSMDLVEGVERAGLTPCKQPVQYLTVKEPVTAAGNYGSFLTFLPCEDPSNPTLEIDCAVDFQSAIGQQRVQFTVDGPSFKHGAFARTNCPARKVIWFKTIGKLFADMRNIGYTNRNILVAGKTEYFNEPRLLHESKSLEAVWHRATLDLLAALSLVEGGRLAGKIISYKAGHSLDCMAVKRLYQQKMLVPVS